MNDKSPNGEKWISLNTVCIIKSLKNLITSSFKINQFKLEIPKGFQFVEVFTKISKRKQRISNLL